MAHAEYCTVVDVCGFLADHRMARFTSYGIDRELVTDEQGRPVAPVPAIKPTTLFRGQNKTYDTLRPSIYRPHPPCATWQSEQTVRIDTDSLRMPHPYYCADLEREFYFSCIKAADLISQAKAMFPDFPDEVNGHALCQHYGLPTHMLDFTQDVWTAGFFASHLFTGNGFIPCEKGIGVIYDLDVEKVPPGCVYEIGIQPLPRPFAQRGFLLQVPPNVNLLYHPAIRQIYFEHSAAASAVIGERFAQGADLVPADKTSDFIEAGLRERFVTRRAIDDYVSRVPAGQRASLETSIDRLFSGQIEIR